MDSVLLAFAGATVTAMSYLARVARYPQAASAALYAHRAFSIHFLTFLGAFTVMCAGTASASTASNAFAGFMNGGFGLWLADGSFGIPAIESWFMAPLSAINLCGVGESIKTNVVLTCVEPTGLLMIIFIGIYAVGRVAPISSR